VPFDGDILVELRREAPTAGSCDEMELAVFTSSTVPAGIVAAFKVEAAKHAQTVAITVMNLSRIILV
jgi:hypothetical protein